MLRYALHSLLIRHTDSPLRWQDAHPQDCAAPGLLRAGSSLPPRPGKTHVLLWLRYKHTPDKWRFSARQHHCFSRDERLARCTQQHPGGLLPCAESTDEGSSRMTLLYKRAKDLYRVLLLACFSLPRRSLHPAPDCSVSSSASQPLRLPHPLLRSRSLCSALFTARKPFGGSGASLGFALPLTQQIYGFARQPGSKGSFLIVFLNKIK